MKVFVCVLLLAVSQEVVAQTSACAGSGSISVAGNSAIATGTATGGVAPDPAICTNYYTGVDLLLDGSYIDQSAKQCQQSLSCTTSATIDTRCMARGQHTLTIRADCPNHNCGLDHGTPGTQTFTIDRPKPSASATYTKAVQLGAYDVHVTYNFPNTSNGLGARVVDILDANRVWVAGCGTSVLNGGESGTCDIGNIDPGCGGLWHVVAKSCNDPELVSDTPFPMPATWYEPEQRYGCGTTDPPPRQPVPSEPACTDCTGDAAQPFNIGSGDVHLTIPLFSIDEPAGALSLAFTYRSARARYSSLTNESGLGWSHSFGAVIRPIDAASDYLYHVNEYGTEAIYLRDATNTTTWNPLMPAVTRRTLTQVGTEYRLTDLNGTVQAFDVTTGRWLSTTDRWGNRTSAEYNANGLLHVIDALGRTIDFVSNGSLIQQVTLPGGATWQFGYTNGSLTSIKDPLHTTSSWRTFTYAANIIGEQRLLTNVADDAGVSLEAHTYDSQDRGTSSTVGSEQVTIQYDTPSAGMRRITHAIDATHNQVSDVTLSVKNGRYVIAAMTGGCATCSGTQGDETRQYDAVSQLTSLTDANNVTTRYSYDSNGQTLTRTEAYGTSLARTTSYTYSTTWPTFVTSESRPGPFGTVTTTRTWSADERALTQQVSGRTTSGGATTTFTTISSYDAHHRLIQVDGPRADVSDVQTRAYYADDDANVLRRGRLQSVTNAAGLTTTFDNYDIYGTARTTTDANAVSTTLQTDARGRVTTNTSNAVTGDSNESTAYTATTNFDTRDRVTSSTRPSGATTTYSYENGTNRLLATIRNDALGRQVERLLITYNFIGWKTKEETQNCATPATTCASWVTQRTESFAYDDRGNLSTITHADNSTIAYSYDLTGQLLSVKDERHASANTSYTYDALRRLKTVTQALAGAPSGQITTTYDYDVADNLTSVTDPNGNTTTYVYDDFGRMISQVSPVTGTTSYSYDPAGNLTSSSDANGATTTRQYDAINRITSAVSIRTGAATESVAWAYDSSTAGIYGRGRLTSTNDPAGTSSYEYDRRGLLRRETKTIEVNSYVSSYGYDANGNRTSMTYPSGRIVTYTFDFADRPLSASSGGTTLASNAVYLPFGALTNLSFGNGTTLTRTFDTRYRISTNKLTLGAATVASYIYGYDLAGNVTALTDATDASFNRAFGYDDLNRLTTANTGTNLWGNGSYSYDPMGNITAIHLGEARNATFAYSGTTPNLTSVIDQGQTMSVSYDAAGNETSVGSRSYAYSSRNSLANTQGFTYTYDARGVRTIATTTGTGLTISSLTVNPTAAGGGDSVTATVTLSGAAPAGGATVSLVTDDERVTTVPPSVLVTAGATSATFTITTQRPQSGSATPTIRAFHQGSTASAILTVNRLPKISSVTISPSSITGGNSTTGTVTIDTVMTSDTVIALSSSNTNAATVPATVTVTAGNSSATFTIATSPADATVTITATYRGTSSATLAITAPVPTLTTITSNPTSVVGGSMNPTGTATLSTPAGSSGAVVTLSSSNSSVASVPSSVTIAAGSTSATFTITTSTVGSSTPVTITGSYGATANASLTVTTCALWTADSAILGTDTVWFDDAVPAGAYASGTWTWTAAQKASGTMSFTHGLGAGQLSNGVDFAQGSFYTINKGDRLVTYALIDPCNTTREIMVRYRDSTRGADVYAYWGENLIGTGGTTIRAGDLPPKGVWTRLEASGSALGLERHLVGAAQFYTYDGRVWFDRVGTTNSCSIATAPAPTVGAETVWVEDAVPAGAITTGTWMWDTNQKASGTQSHTSPPVSGMGQHWFQVGSNYLQPASNDTLITYVMPSACDTPREIMLRFTYNGSNDRYAYWGEDLISTSPAAVRIGDLPTAGQWTRLEIAASTLSLGGTNINGVGYRVYDGQAWWDRTGKIGPQANLVAPNPSVVASADLIGAEPISLTGRVLRWLRSKFRRTPAPPPLALAVTTKVTNAVGPTRQYSFYTPQLHLMAETALTDATTPSIAYEYIWFNSEPLVQINVATGEIAYDFNDHLASPLLQTDGSAAVVWRAERDAYGVRSLTRAGVNRHQALGLAGQETNENSPDLQYNVARWYRSDWGRYTQADPLGLSATNNVFAYVDGSPVNFVDPLGFAKKNDPSELECCELLDKIEENSRELKRKEWEERDIQNRLRQGIESRTNIEAIIKYYIHRREYRKIQERLRALLDEYDDRNCQPPVPRQWREWNSNPFPNSDYLWELWGNRINQDLDEVVDVLARPRPRTIGPLPTSSFWQQFAY